MKFKRSMWSYFTIFFLVAAVAAASVLIYDTASKHTDEADTIIITVCVIFALALACAIIDIFRRRRTVEAPVEKILKATEVIAKGDFSVRLTPKHSYKRFDQYDLIMEDINDMAIQLSKAETMKADFVSNVSHELKTPLAILQNYSHALKNKDLNENTREKYLDVIESASKRMSSLVTNILNLNKLENQQLQPEYELINLNEMLETTVLSFEEFLDYKGIELECDFDDVTISSSRGYLELIFNNLISNAIKFSNEGGKIVLTLKQTETQAIVSVRDFGLGMSKETGAHIFDKFYQGDTSHAQEGNGLGLAIVKRVIDLLGGEISVESELGEGSVFTVKLRKTE